MMIQRTLVFALLAAAVAGAQPEPNHVFVSGGVAGGFSFQSRISSAPVEGAPYSATVTNETVQTLADGNRIVQSSTGATARDSMGRTRQDAPLPPIGNMRPADAPRIVFVQDPVAQTSYTLNLTDKTAVKNPGPGPGPGMAMPTLSVAAGSPAGAGDPGPVTIRAIAGPVPATPMAPVISFSGRAVSDGGKAQTEDLGSKTMEGVTVTGVRTTHTIPAGEIGNDKPITVVTEVWTSPELKTVIYSKRSDPRMGDQTFQLTNIVRAEPDPSLFTVPSDFTIRDTPGPIMYKTSGGPGQ
jgi:hypothetical protein